MKLTLILSSSATFTHTSLDSFNVAFTLSIFLLLRYEPQPPSLSTLHSSHNAVFTLSAFTSPVWGHILTTFPRLSRSHRCLPFHNARYFSNSANAFLIFFCFSYSSLSSSCNSSHLTGVSAYLFFQMWLCQHRLWGNLPPSPDNKGLYGSGPDQLKQHRPNPAESVPGRPPGGGLGNSIGLVG